MVTRRALLGAGAVALLAGCGAPEEAKVDTEAVVGEQLKLADRALASYEAVPGTAKLRENARDRLLRLQAASTERFGRGTPATSTHDLSDGVEDVLAAETAVLRAGVAAIGEVKDTAWRELFAGVVADSAANQSALLALLERPPLPTAFPGEPV